MRIRRPVGVYTRPFGDWFADDIAIGVVNLIGPAGDKGATFVNNGVAGEILWILDVTITTDTAGGLNVSYYQAVAGTVQTNQATFRYLDLDRGVPIGQFISPIITGTPVLPNLQYRGSQNERTLSASMGAPLAALDAAEGFNVLTTGGTATAFTMIVRYIPLIEPAPRFTAGALRNLSRLIPG